MTLPINKRDFDVFLSHAHTDQALAARLDEWLTRAGFAVWYDARELPGGALLATDLQKAIGRCRGMLLVASGESMARGWVKLEYNAGMNERANHDAFRVVALRVANADVSELMQGISWIDLPEPQLTESVAMKAVTAFCPGEDQTRPDSAQDVYVSCSWQSQDSTSARAVCRELVRHQFRLIGDARDQMGFGAGDRVVRIIASCGGFVGIIPYRDEAVASASEQPYKYFLRELDLAVKQELPVVVVADPRVRRTDASDERWLRMDTDAKVCPGPVASALENLSDQWRSPPRPQYVFCAMDLDSEAARSVSPARGLIERVTGMSTIVGTEVREQAIRSGIMNKVRKAFLVVADITDDNVNACIEAGMGLAADTNVELLARGQKRRPPFMLGDLQLETYEDDVERIAVLHGIARRYRRRVINAELSRTPQ